MTQKKQDLNANNFAEAQLQLTWNRLKTHQPIAVNDKNNWVMLSPGTWNLEAGPDFLNAKFTKNDETITGDVEIHKKTSDWAIHGHHNDALYQNVVLHVVARDDSEDCSPDMAEKLPLIPMFKLQPKNKSARLAMADKFPHGRCENIFTAIDDKKLEQLFKQAGMKRLREKVDIFLEDMCSNGINSAFLKRIFDACGYKKNRPQFNQLFQRFNAYDDLSPAAAEAVLWGESGLLPDPVTAELDPTMQQFVSRLWETWWQYRRDASTAISWVRSGIRPMNSPERRIAALNILLNQLGKEPLLAFAKFAKSCADEKDFLKKVYGLLRCDHPLWNQYYSFQVKTAKPSMILGNSRIADICVNTVFPALKAYSILTGDNHTGNFIDRVYRSMPKAQTNRILETAALKWFMPPARQKNIFTNAVTQQGAIHIFRNFCEETCIECEICPLRELMGS